MKFQKVQILTRGAKSMITIYNLDNKRIKGLPPQSIDLVYADMLYENRDFEWLVWSRMALKPNGILIIQTDYHTVADIYLLLREEMNFINWCIYKQEWGGTSKRFYPRKHDDILIFSKSKDYKFYPDRIQIPKITAGTKFDKKGTGLKTPCDVFDDLGNFSTMSKERVKLDGKNVEWQKPLKLMNRLLLPFTDVGDTVLDPFMGVGTTGVWCKLNDRNFIGIELDKKKFALAEERINNT